MSQNQQLWKHPDLGFSFYFDSKSHLTEKTLPAFLLLLSVTGFLTAQIKRTTLLLIE